MEIKKANSAEKRDELWEKFVEVFSIEPDVYGRARANKELAGLRKAGISPADLDWWLTWFRKWDHGGKNGNPPSLPIFRMTWGAAKTKRDQLVQKNSPPRTEAAPPEPTESETYLYYQFDSWRDSQTPIWWTELSAEERAQRIKQEKDSLAWDQHFKNHPMALDNCAETNAKTKLAQEKTNFQEWLAARKEKK